MAVGKVTSLLNLPLKPDAVFKKQRATKISIHLQDKVNQLLDILEQNEIIYLVNKEEQPKGNTFINPFSERRITENSSRCKIPQFIQ